MLLYAALLYAALLNNVLLYTALFNDVLLYIALLYAALLHAALLNDVLNENLLLFTEIIMNIFYILYVYFYNIWLPESAVLEADLSLDMKFVFICAAHIVFLCSDVICSNVPAGGFICSLILFVCVRLLKSWWEEEEIPPTIAPSHTVFITNVIN